MCRWVIQFYKKNSQGFRFTCSINRFTYCQSHTCSASVKRRKLQSHMHTQYHSISNNALPHSSSISNAVKWTSIHRKRYTTQLQICKHLYLCWMRDVHFSFTFSLNSFIRALLNKECHYSLCFITVYKCIAAYIFIFLSSVLNTSKM